MPCNGGCLGLREGERRVSCALARMVSIAHGPQPKKSFSFPERA